MSIIICPECQENVSNKANECPHCGFVFKRSFFTGGKIIGCFFIFFLVGLLLFALFLKMFANIGTKIIEKGRVLKAAAIKKLNEDSVNKEITVESIKEYFEKIKSIKYTEAVKLKKQLKNQKISWEVYVVDVSRYSMNKYLLKATPSKDSNWFQINVYFEEKESIEKLEALKQGDKVNITAILNNFTRGKKRVILKPAKLE